MTKIIKFFLIAFVLSFVFFLGINIFQENLESFFYAQISKPFEEMVFVRVPPKKQKLNLAAKSAISLKINKFGREKILFRQNSDQILPIASLTKLMTALIILENPESYDFNKVITISKEAANQENVPEYGNLDMEVGKKFKVETLLNLMLIYSSNDAAWALTEVIGPDHFVEKMNQKAKILTLVNTYFVNPTGLDPENLHWDEENKDYFNYSTSNDLMKLTKYILEEFPLIFEFSAQKNKFDILPSQKIIGMKTGYTDEAGGCIFLVFSDENENYFINIILGTESKEARFEEMQKLIDWINQ